jgi:hypothetical protein
LDLFAASISLRGSTSPDDPNFYRPVVARNFEKPLIDLFPEAYE